MKTCLLLFVVIGFGTTTFAQANVSATAQTSATIVTPLAIVQAADLNFGNVAVNATAGTVVLPAASGVPVRTTTGGVTLPSTVGTVSAAAFTVTGDGNYTYAITLPQTAVVITDGTNNMDVDNFVSTPTVGAGGQLSSGTQTLYVGATLNVGSSQPAGVYNNAADLVVSVVYN